MPISFTLSGTETFRLNMRTLNIHNYKKVFNAIGRDIRRELRKVFNAEGAYPGGQTRWPELKPRYAAWKQRVAPGKPMLELSGSYKKSVTIRGARGNIHRVTRRSIQLGSAIPYAIQMEQGVPKRNVSARPISRVLTQEMRDRWNDWLTQTWRDPNHTPRVTRSRARVQFTIRRR